MEYAYRDDSVNRAESNCRRYTASDNEGTIPFPDQYIHCNGTQLKLTDSNLGQDQYRSGDYYWWSAGSDAQLLFIFPTRVSLTTITLHYYSDSVRGLPRLTLYAVPDDFDISNAPTSGYTSVDVAAVPGGKPAGGKSVSINVNFNTRKVLMFKYESEFQLAVSELQFFNCSSKLISSICPLANELLLKCIQHLQQLQ